MNEELEKKDEPRHAGLAPAALPDAGERTALKQDLIVAPAAAAPAVAADERYRSFFGRLLSA